MKELTLDEILWLENCVEEPERYRIDVDNDSVWVTDIEKDECVFTFNGYGWEMNTALLRYIGCNAEEV